MLPYLQTLCSVYLIVKQSERKDIARIIACSARDFHRV